MAGYCLIGNPEPAVREPDYPLLFTAPSRPLDRMAGSQWTIGQQAANSGYSLSPMALRFAVIRTPGYP
jgi:hypothetical protein